MSHTEQARILESARRRPQIWRLPVLLAVGFIASALLPTVIYIAVGLISRDLMAIAPSRDGGLAIGASQGGLFILLAGFALLILATVFCARWLHKRRISDLTGPSGEMRAQFVVTFKWVLGLTVAVFLLPWESGDMMIEPKSGFTVWLAWLPLALLGLMVQVSAEELFFRGYLQSQLIATLRVRWLGILIASVLFGLGHVNATSTGWASAFPVIWATLFGIFAGDLTIRSGTIGPAVALHLVNNAMAMLLIPQDGMLSGFGLYVRMVPQDQLLADPVVMAAEIGFIFLTWLAARIAIRR